MNAVSPAVPYSVADRHRRLQTQQRQLGYPFRIHNAEVSNCVGEASVVTVHNKKLIGDSYEIALKFQGEWLIEEEMKQIQGTSNVPEASFGDLEDMRLNVTLNTDGESRTSKEVRLLKILCHSCLQFRIDCANLKQS